MIVSDECTQLGLSDSEVIRNLLGNLDLIIFGIHVRIDLGSLDRSFDGYNDDK